MADNLLEMAKRLYRPEHYGYKEGGNGTRDMTGDGIEDIDCSGLVSKVLRHAGYEIPYPSPDDRFNTAWLRSKEAEKYFEVVKKEDVQSGDIVVWGPPPGHKYGHTGFVEDYDARTNRGHLYGSNQSTDGPDTIGIPRDRLSLKPENGGVKFLRPKAEFSHNYMPGEHTEEVSSAGTQLDDDEDFYFTPGMSM